MIEPVADIEVRLARTRAELDAAQQLRYRVFFEEWGAHPDPRMRRLRRDVDPFDADMDHLIVIDHRRSPAEGQVVGNYRLQRSDGAGAAQRFYSGGEFDLGVLFDGQGAVMELGRSCVLRDYRSRPILQLLWRAIVDYAAEHRVGVLFGCASLRGTDPEAVREQLAYLHHFHLAPSAVRPRALGPGRVPMDVMAKSSVDVERARRALEPLIKGYLRQGAWIGDGAYVDRQFNSIDVCIVLPVERLGRRLLRAYHEGVRRHQPAGQGCEADDVAVAPGAEPLAAFG